MCQFCNTRIQFDHLDNVNNNKQHGTDSTSIIRKTMEKKSKRYLFYMYG